MIQQATYKRIFLSCLVLLVTACLILAVWAGIAFAVLKSSPQPTDSYDQTAWQTVTGGDRTANHFDASSSFGDHF